MDQLMIIWFKEQDLKYALKYPPTMYMKYDRTDNERMLKEKEKERELILLRQKLLALKRRRIYLNRRLRLDDGTEYFQVIADN